MDFNQYNIKSYLIIYIVTNLLINSVNKSKLFGMTVV